MTARDRLLPTGPIDASERIVLLDGVRGFALLGILIANMLTFSGYMFMDEGQRAALSIGPIDTAVDFAIETFVHGKFYALFSLLFGIGFAMQLGRIEQRGETVGRYARRLSVLALFGLAHLLLVWIGDILLLYALMGFVLLAFRNLSNRALLWGAALLWAVPVAWAAYKFLAGFNPFATFMPRLAPMAGMLGVPFGPGTQAEVYGSPDLMLHLKAHPIEFVLRFIIYLDEMRFTKVLAMFFIGLWIGRHAIPANLARFEPLMRKMAIVGVAAGLPMALLHSSIVMGWIGDPQTLGTVLAAETSYCLAVPLMGMGYASLFGLAWLHGRRTLIETFAPAGRMALTNYLMQSIVQSVIFYGWGLGLFGEIPISLMLILSLAIFAAQILLSRWWLATHRFGPMEWLWRTLTWGQSQPMRLESHARAVSAS